MKLSALIKRYRSSFLTEYGGKIRPAHLKALGAMEICRTRQSPKMQVTCMECDHDLYIPHSCGHRNCPHCQAHESQQWLERQLKKQVPADYYLVTFTLPAEFRSLAWRNQKELYNLLIKMAWETLKTFSQNDKHLQGVPGAIAVLHTHSRALAFHPHVHIVIPAAAIDKEKRLWRTKTARPKQGKRGGGGKNSRGHQKTKPYLFDHKALAMVFRARMLEGIRRSGLSLPDRYPEKWVVDCKFVGSGEKALVYLGRYLYRGVIQEKDIISDEEGCVTFRYQDSTTKKRVYKTVTGAHFLWLVLRHVLPKGFRRARNFGFLHPNSKQLIQVVQWLQKLDPNQGLAWMRERPKMICPCCGGILKIIKTRILPAFEWSLLRPT